MICHVNTWHNATTTPTLFGTSVIWVRECETSAPHNRKRMEKILVTCTKSFELKIPHCLHKRNTQLGACLHHIMQLQKSVCISDKLKGKLTSACEKWKAQDCAKTIIPCWSRQFKSSAWQSWKRTYAGPDARLFTSILLKMMCLSSWRCCMKSGSPKAVMSSAVHVVIGRSISCGRILSQPLCLSGLSQI